MPEVTKEDIQQTSEYVKQATAGLKERMAETGYGIDTSKPIEEIAVCDSGTKTISMNLEKMARRIKQVEQEHPGEGYEWAKGVVTEEVTHAEIESELAKMGKKPPEHYAKVFIELTPEQYKILKEVYGPLETRIVNGREVRIPPGEQAVLYGGEWLRIERMLARGEKIPQEFGVTKEKMEILLDEMNKWRIQHPSEKTVMP